jgi:hypothetical protein
MSDFCFQLKQNLETIKTLKSELDLELPKLEVLFKELKNGKIGNPSASLRIGDPSASLRAGRKDLMNKVKAIKNRIDSEIGAVKRERFNNFFNSLPDKESRRTEIPIGVDPRPILADRISLPEPNEDKIYISDLAKKMLESHQFQISGKKESITLVRLKVSELGFSRVVSDKEPFGSISLARLQARARQVGLEFCPAEVAPRLIIVEKYLNSFFKDQGSNEPLNILSRPFDMKNDFSEYSLRLFRLIRQRSRMIEGTHHWLDDGPCEGWSLSDNIVLCYRDEKV